MRDLLMHIISFRLMQYWYATRHVAFTAGFKIMILPIILFIFRMLMPASLHAKIDDKQAIWFDMPIKISSPFTRLWYDDWLAFTSVWQWQAQLVNMPPLRLWNRRIADKPQVLSRRAFLASRRAAALAASKVLLLGPSFYCRSNDYFCLMIYKCRVRKIHAFGA